MSKRSEPGDFVVVDGELVELPVGTPVIAVEGDQQCDFCGVVDELRPYGPNGEAICYGCGMKDEATTARRFREVMFGEEGSS